MEHDLIATDGCIDGSPLQPDSSSLEEGGAREAGGWGEDH